jgi:hypothetical protein
MCVPAVGKILGIKQTQYPKPITTTTSAPPPPTQVASSVESPRKLIRGTVTKKKRGTSQLTYRSPSVGITSAGSGVSMNQTGQ